MQTGASSTKSWTSYGGEPGACTRTTGSTESNRIVGRHPEWLEWQVIQNSNAHEEGFTAAWDGIRHALWVDRSAETEAPLAPFLQLEGVKLVYTHGHRDPEQISPDNWNMDLHFLERPGARMFSSTSCTTAGTSRSRTRSTRSRRTSRAITTAGSMARGRAPPLNLTESTP